MAEKDNDPTEVASPKALLSMPPEEAFRLALDDLGKGLHYAHKTGQHDSMLPDIAVRVATVAGCGGRLMIETLDRMLDTAERELQRAREETERERQKTQRALKWQIASVIIAALACGASIYQTWHR